MAQNNAHDMQSHAGMLFYGTKYWGITEANYLLVLLHTATGFLGPSIWRADVAALLGIKLPFTLLVNDCLLCFIAFFAISYSSAAFYRVLNVDQVRPANIRLDNIGNRPGALPVFSTPGSCNCLHAEGCYGMMQPHYSLCSTF